jgi:hypothetical protein
MSRNGSFADSDSVCTSSREPSRQIEFTFHSMSAERCRLGWRRGEGENGLMSQCCKKTIGKQLIPNQESIRDFFEIQQLSRHGVFTEFVSANHLHLIQFPKFRCDSTLRTGIGRGMSRANTNTRGCQDNIMGIFVRWKRQRDRQEEEAGQHQTMIVKIA